MLRIGIPREIKIGEKRVGLTPRGVQKLFEAGAPVRVESLAGVASGYSDKDYEKAGAAIVSTPQEVYDESELVQKVKEPQRLEWDFLHPHLILCSYLHLASPDNRDLVEALMYHSVTAVGFETVNKEGRTILLQPMSEIAGTLAAFYAPLIRESIRIVDGKISYPKQFAERMEALAADYPSIPKGMKPVKAVVFGGGVAGKKAADAILEMGGEVDLIEKKHVRRFALQAKLEKYGKRAHVWDVLDDIKERLRAADVWIGCVHIPGERAPLVMSVDDMRKLSLGKPKVIMDVAADQGGNFPESCPTTYDHPLYLDSCNNFRFGVTNIPSLCGRGASFALEEATLPYLLALAKEGRRALADTPELRSGVQVFMGKLVNQAVAKAHHMKWFPLTPSDFEE